jgi:hypothetical protein
MNDHDQLNDDAVLRELRDSLSGVITPERPRLEAIRARGRAHRRRRLTAIAGLSVAAAAAGAALVLGLTGVLGPAPARGAGTIRTAAFTLVRNADGTDALTIHPRVLFDPTTLQNDLARYGIPARVTTGSFCSSDPAPADLSQVMTSSPALQGNGGYQHLQDPTVTIDPAAMPAGSELSFGTFQVSTGQETAIALIDTNSYTCTSTAPTTLPPSGALLLYGQQAGS